MWPLNWTPCSRIVLVVYGSGSQNEGDPRMRLLDGDSKMNERLHEATLSDVALFQCLKGMCTTEVWRYLSAHRAVNAQPHPTPKQRRRGRGGTEGANEVSHLLAAAQSGLCRGDSDRKSSTEAERGGENNNTRYKTQLTGRTSWWERWCFKEGQKKWKINEFVEHWEAQKTGHGKEKEELHYLWLSVHCVEVECLGGVQRFGTIIWHAADPSQETYAIWWPLLSTNALQ